MTFLPARIKREKKTNARECAPHRQWVRLHQCAACGTQTAIECAHVRSGTDGGLGLKPSDCWCISLCREHHNEQHQLGEPAFEAKYRIDMKALAQTFARLSPHRHKLEQSQ